MYLWNKKFGAHDETTFNLWSNTQNRNFKGS